ncbi:MAG: hypothetical protein IPN76_32310 [Saprospiraceae bacterium]|nr:hypothetical protein [Saprospiraceae bacterium]
MKKAFVIFTAAIIFISSMSNAILYAGFRFNQTEIEQLYCVNKAKPQKQCHGKCHLKKQLQKNNDHNGSPTPSSNLEDSFKLNLYLQAFTPLAQLAHRTTNQEIFVKAQTANSRLFGDSLFQPPDYQSFVC